MHFLTMFWYIPILSQIKREVIKNTKWWKKDKVESMEQAIIRQVENMFTKNNIQF